MNAIKSIQLLIKEHKSKNKGLCSNHYSEKNINRIYIDNQDFALFKEKFKVEFPDELIYFYSQIGCEDNDFTRQFKYNLENDVKPIMLLHYSENFAKLICEEYFKLNDGEKASLIQLTEKISKGGFHPELQEVVQYILLEPLTFFDFEKGRFSIDFLESIYKKYYDDSLLEKSWTTWAHCGGCGSIILNTSRKGFDGGEQFGTFHEIEYNGKKYEYRSNYWKHLEKHHLEAYRDLLEDQEYSGNDIILPFETREQPRTMRKTAIASIRRLLRLR